MIERYFDNAATTPLDPRVVAAMLPFLNEEFGNANSIHGYGLRARQAVERARQQVADLIGAEDPQQVIFTSGATESNNWIGSAVSQSSWMSPFEHSAMREPGIANGWHTLENESLSLHSPPETCKALSIMSVNNEIGARWDLQSFQGPWVLHSDMTQEVGKLPVNVSAVDYASFSAHKFYGPKGVGCLFYRDAPPAPGMRGGDQEWGLRGGTLNVPGIVGMGAAAQISLEELPKDLEKAQHLRSIFLDEFNACPDTMVHGGEQVSPYILSISFADVEGETLVIESDRMGFGVSSGAACSARSTEPSHVLTALGIEERFLRGTIRISTGRFNDVENTATFAKNLLRLVEKLRRMKQLRG